MSPKSPLGKALKAVKSKSGSQNMAPDPKTRESNVDFRENNCGEVCPCCGKGESRELKIKLSGHDPEIGYHIDQPYYEAVWREVHLVVCENCGCVFVKGAIA